MSSEPPAADGPASGRDGDPTSSSPVRAKSRETGSRLPAPVRLLLRYALLVAIPYLMLVIVLAAFQRSLIYFPYRASEITEEQAAFPAGQVRTIRVTTHDGLELRGWHLLADDAGAEPDNGGGPLTGDRLLVIYFSGNAGNRAYRVPEFEIFTAAGADVFAFDYRGYGDNPGSPSEADFAADARTIWEHATRDRGVPPNRIVLFGESLGTGVATRLAAERSQAGTPPAGLALRAPFSSLADVGAWHYPWLPVRLVLIDRYPSAELIGDVTCPILVVHGTEDTIIPAELARRLYEAAPPESASGVPKRFVELVGADHNDVVFAAGGLYRETLAEFFETVRP